MEGTSYNQNNDSSNTASRSQSYLLSLLSVSLTNSHHYRMVTEQLSRDSSTASSNLRTILMHLGEEVREYLLQQYANSVLGLRTTDLEYAAERLVETAVQNLLANQDEDAIYATNVLLRLLNITGRTTIQEWQTTQTRLAQPNTHEPAHANELAHANEPYLASLASNQPGPDLFTQTPEAILHLQPRSRPQTITDSLIDPSLLPQQTISSESQPRTSSAALAPPLAPRTGFPRFSPHGTVLRTVLQSQKQHKNVPANNTGTKKQQKSEKPAKAQARTTFTSTNEKLSTTSKARARPARTTSGKGGFAPKGMRYLCPHNARHEPSESRCRQYRQKVGDLQAHVRNTHGVEWGRAPGDWANCGPFTWPELRARGVTRPFRERKAKKAAVPLAARVADEERLEEEDEEEEDEEEREKKEESEEDNDGDVDMSDGDNEPRRDNDDDDGRGDGHARPQMIAVF